MADELNLHSFRTHADGSVTWVRWREQPPAHTLHKNTGKDKVDPKNSSGEPSKRALKSIERARSFRKRMESAMKFRCSAALRRWKELLPGSNEMSAAQRTGSRGPGDGLPGSAARPVGADGASPSRAPSEAKEAAPNVPKQNQHLVPPLGQAGSAALVANEERRPGLQSPPADCRANVANAHAMCVSPSTHSPRGGASLVSQPPRTQPEHACGVLHGPPACAGAQQQPPGQSMLQHLRQHEFPGYMQYHMMQGVPEWEARRRWDEYECMRMSTQ